MKFNFYTLLALIAVICLCVIAGALLSISNSLSKGIEVDINNIPRLHVIFDDYELLNVNIKSMPTMDTNVKTMPTMDTNVKTMPTMDTNVKTMPTMDTNVKTMPIMNTNVMSMPTMNTNVKSMPTIDTNTIISPDLCSDFNVRVKFWPSTVLDVDLNTLDKLRVIVEDSSSSNSTKLPFSIF